MQIRLLRHTMATLMLEGAADICFIQEMLGHVDPKTTQIYPLVSMKKLRPCTRPRIRGRSWNGR